LNVRAVVFDFDGVIANSEPLHFRAYADVLAPRGIQLREEDYYARYLGYDDVGAFLAIAGDHERRWSEEEVKDLVRRKAQRLEHLERSRSVLFAGAADAIRRLSAEVPLAIASGALRAEILRVLERENLASHFKAVVGAEDAPSSKPAPDPYLRAVQLIGVEFEQVYNPSDCVAVEDSRWGLESARSAGLATIAVTHTYPASALTIADAVVAHLDDLTLEFLRTLRR
jgi:HAD superfamily hydrolase (TIGR01509 family)